MQIGFIVILIIAIFVAIFAIQNGTPVPIDLFFARYEMPLAVIMMICLILGAVIILILGTTRQFKKRSEQKELKNKIKTLEGEKAQTDINFKALESDKENLIKTNDDLSSKITQLEEEKRGFVNKIAQLEKDKIEFENKIAEFQDIIKSQEEALAPKLEELGDKSIETVSEILDEGVAQIDNEDSEVESQ